MKSENASTASIGKRAIDELKEFAVVAAYLCVCFTAILYLKASILKAEGIAFAPFGFAVIKALICAKFVSVGHILHLGERFKSLPLIWPTLYKSLVFLILWSCPVSVDGCRLGSSRLSTGRSGQRRSRTWPRLPVGNRPRHGVCFVIAALEVRR